MMNNEQVRAAALDDLCHYDVWQGITSRIGPVPMGRYLLKIDVADLLAHALATSAAPERPAHLATENNGEDCVALAPERSGKLADDLPQLRDCNWCDNCYSGNGKPCTAPVQNPAPEADSSSEIPGLGRMTDEDNGIVTLQFKDEDAAQQFMHSYWPSVDVRDMPPIPADSSSAAPSDKNAKGYRPPCCDGGGADTACCDGGCVADRELAELAALAAPSPTRESLGCDSTLKAAAACCRMQGSTKLADAVLEIDAALATPRQTEDGGLSAAEAGQAMSEGEYNYAALLWRQLGVMDHASVKVLIDHCIYTAYRNAQRHFLAPAVQGGVPEGWQLVPVEPTNEMARIGGHVNSEYLNDNAPIGENRYRLPIATIWRDMLATSPAPTGTSK